MRFIDFFSGVGGFTRGMELAGHTCVGHCEIDKYAEASYRSMHTITEEQRQHLMTLPLKQRQKEILKEEYLNGEWYADNVTRVSPESVPEAECYCFGFPCQAFSIAGHRRGFEDTRGTLFFEIMRIAKERHPQLLFAENVAGLLNHAGGVTFQVIINTMAELGYFVEWQVCNSKHFGVPQNRERVFIIGHSGTGNGREVFPVGVHDRSADELQGQRNNNRMISNTLDTRIKGNTRGTYPIIGGGYSEGQRLPQGLIGGTAEHKKPRLTDIAMTLDTRIGATPGFNETYVIMPNESNTDRKHNTD